MIRPRSSWRPERKGAPIQESDGAPVTAPTVAELVPTLQYLCFQLGQLAEAAFRDGVATGLRELVFDDDVGTRAGEHAAQVPGVVAGVLLRHLDRMQQAEGLTLDDLLQETTTP